MRQDVSDLGSPGDGSRGGDAAGKPKAEKPQKTGSDVVLIHGVTEDGKGLNVLRARDERIEVGQVRPLEEGKPLTGDVVRLTPRPDAPYLCDVETEVRVKAPAQSVARRSSTSAAPNAPASAPRRHGPPQVASDAYRRNWDAIWKSRDDKSKLPN